MPNNEKPDAAVPIDAAIDAPKIDAAPDANPCGNNRVVYINFGGATINKANTSDATQNDASWPGAATVTMSAWGGSTTDQTAVVTQLQNTFTAVNPNIQIVTTAPTNGPYIMIGIGGNMNQAGVQFTGAVNTLNCSDTNKSSLGWVFDGLSNAQTANFAAGAIGYGMGMGGTGNSNDCMCSWNSQCNPGGGACTFSASVNTQNGCAGAANPQDDQAVLQAFCD